MGKDTGVDWCDHTFNPWWGCWKISPGCKNCYAAAFDHRLGGDHWQRGGPRKFNKEGYWQQPLKWNKAAAKAGVRAKVFCASMADILEQHPDPAIAALQYVARQRVWQLVDDTPELDWLFLTKRPEGAQMFPWVREGTCKPNAWLGVTAEDDEHAIRRIPLLQEMRPHFAKLFISYEPAVGPIWWNANLLRGIDWVIFGDESGRGRRDAELPWARMTRDACAQNGVTFFFKQWCGDDVEGVGGDRHKGKIHLPILDGTTHESWPA